MTVPYISISESDIEEAVKDVVGLGRTIDLPGGGYLDTLEVLAGLTFGRRCFREAALNGVYKRLELDVAWLRRQVKLAVEEKGE